MLSRRSFLKWLGGLSLGGFLTGTYALAIEPGFRLNTTVYAFTPPKWTPGLKLRIVMLADLHCVEPHMPLSRWKRIIAAANALQPDMHVLMGDYVASHRFSTGKVSFEQVAEAALELKSPLGTFAIMGNHDWWDDPKIQLTGRGIPHAQQVFGDAGLRVLDNEALNSKKRACHFGCQARIQWSPFAKATANLIAEPTSVKRLRRSRMTRPSFTSPMSRTYLSKCQIVCRLL